MVNMVAVFVIVKKVGKVQSAIFQKVIVVLLIVPDMVSVCKVHVTAKLVGRVKHAMKKIAKILPVQIMELVFKDNAIAKLAGKDNTAI